MLSVESAPEPLAVGVNEVAVRLICPAPMVAGSSAQSVNEPASHES